MSFSFPGAFEVDHPTREYMISFRSVELEIDLERLHQWMNEPHVIPFWQLNLSLEKYEQHLRSALVDDHQQLYIGSIDGIPMSYWEAYWVKGDVLEQAYDFHSADQGIHLLIGPTAFLGKGYAQPLLQALTAQLFCHEATEKIVAEPDVRNKKMIHILEKAGFQAQLEIELPDKRALLMFCERS